MPRNGMFNDAVKDEVRDGCGYVAGEHWQPVAGVEHDSSLTACEPFIYHATGLWG